MGSGQSRSSSRRPAADEGVELLANEEGSFVEESEDEEEDEEEDEVEAAEHPNHAYGGDLIPHSHSTAPRKRGIGTEEHETIAWWSYLASLVGIPGGIFILAVIFDPRRAEEWAASLGFPSPDQRSVF